MILIPLGLPTAHHCAITICSFVRELERCQWDAVGRELCSIPDCLDNMANIRTLIWKYSLESHTLFDRLQKLQNRGARVLTFSSYDADANCLIRQLDWKDLSTQFQIQKIIMIYKCLRWLHIVIGQSSK